MFIDRGWIIPSGNKIVCGNEYLVCVYNFSCFFYLILKTFSICLNKKKNKKKIIYVNIYFVLSFFRLFSDISEFFSFIIFLPLLFLIYFCLCLNFLFFSFLVFLGFFIVFLFLGLEVFSLL